MSKNDRINNILLQYLAEAVNKEIGMPNVLITVTYVDCSSDLKQAKIGISVLPDNLAGSTLKALKAKTGQIVGDIKKHNRLRRLPHLKWEFDNTEREADKIEKLIASI